MDKKEIDYQKKFEAEKKLREKEINSWENNYNELSNERDKLQNQLEEKSKGYKISLSQQSFTIKELSKAREKVKALMDVGLWYINLEEIN